MGRYAKVWQRSDRPGWYATVNGRQKFVDFGEKTAKRKFHLLKADREVKDRPVCDVLDLDLEDVKAKPNTIRLYRLFRESFAIPKRLMTSQLTPQQPRGWMRPTWNGSTQRTGLPARGLRRPVGLRRVPGSPRRPG